MAAPVTITFLGGLGEIGRNCMVLESRTSSCCSTAGSCSPSSSTSASTWSCPTSPGCARTPTASIGCIATHGHEDHVGGLSFLLRELSFPIYGSALTLGLARNRIEEAGLLGKTELIPVDDGERRKIGPFDVEFIPVTHSVPHGFATAFHTPQGVILHTGDWKLDLTPVDGRLTDLARIGAIAVRARASGCCWPTPPTPTATATRRSEKSVGAVLYDLFHEHEGRRIVIACFASHIHRVQQIADAAIAFGRKVATLGLSMKKNMRLAREMGLLHIPESSIVDIEDIGDLRRRRGLRHLHRQPGRADVGADPHGHQREPVAHDRRGRHGDPVLAPDPRQRDERQQGDRRARPPRRRGRALGIEDVHATGHAKQEEIKTLLSIVEPEWFVPGARRVPPPRRPRRAGPDHGRAAPSARSICEDGDQLTIDDEGIRVSGQVPAGYLYVDGIVGDVGHGVLRDRRVLAEEGVVVVVVTVDIEDGAIITGPEIITRGWVYAPEAEDLLDECADVVRQAVKELFAEAGDARHRGAPARRAPGRRPVRQRPHQAQAHDRPRGHGGLGPAALSSVHADPSGIRQDDVGGAAAARCRSCLRSRRCGGSSSRWWRAADRRGVGAPVAEVRRAALAAAAAGSRPSAGGGSTCCSTSTTAAS